jgi:hypothetical protein
MKKLKDVTLNLKAVDSDVIAHLFDFGRYNAEEFDLFVTDAGYDLVRDDEKKGLAIGYPAYEGPTDGNSLPATPENIEALRKRGLA